MNCKDYEPLLSAYLDRELSAEDQREVGRHLESCRDCQRESKSLLSVKEILRSQPMPALPREVLAEIEARTIFHRPWWERSFPFLAIERSSDPASEERHPRGRSNPRLIAHRWAPAALALAAALGAWALLRHHQTALRGAPLDVVIKPVTPGHEHTRVVLRRNSSSEESQDCRDSPRGC